jgi:hypothetical protein
MVKLLSSIWITVRLIHYSNLIATLFPFLESWQVTRFAVFLCLCFLVIAWKLIGVFRESFVHALTSVSGIYFLLAARIVFVGRSDVTVVFLLLRSKFDFILPRRN